MLQDKNDDKSIDESLDKLRVKVGAEPVLEGGVPAGGVPEDGDDNKADADVDVAVAVAADMALTGG